MEQRHGPQVMHLTAPKYSPTSALCKHLPAVLWRKFSSHEVSVQLHSKWHQCRCMPLTPDMHRVTQNLIGKGSGRRKKEHQRLYMHHWEGGGGSDWQSCLRAREDRWQRNALLQSCSSLASTNMKPDNCTSGKKMQKEKKLKKKKKRKRYTFQRKQNLLAYGAFCWDSTWIHAPKH